VGDDVNLFCARARPHFLDIVPKLYCRIFCAKTPVVGEIEEIFAVTIAEIPLKKLFCVCIIGFCVEQRNDIDAADDATRF